MSDELDDLGIDLHAWEAPPPPAGLADAAIARALAVDEAIAITAHKRRNRRYAYAGVATAGLAAAAAAAIWIGARGDDASVPDVSIVAADSPRHFTSGGASAELAPGASLVVRRDGNALHVHQTGAATWTVGAGDQLFIDAGSASLAASGATRLRVEAPMNLSDIKIVGTITAISAGVALLSATIYEGHIQATSHGDTVVVPANSLVAVGGAQPPAVTPVIVSAPAPATDRTVDLVVGSSSTDDDGATLELLPGASARVAANDGRVELRVTAPCPGAFWLRRNDKPLATIMLDANQKAVVSLAVGSYSYDAVCAGSSTQYAGTISVTLCGSATCHDEFAASEPPQEPGRSTITSTSVRMRAHRPDPDNLAKLDACAKAIQARRGDNPLTDLQVAEAMYRCEPIEPAAAHAFDAACAAHELELARSYWRDMPSYMQLKLAPMCAQYGYSAAQITGQLASAPAAAPAAPAAPAAQKPCDADKLAANGDDAMGNSDFDRAVTLFEQAYACKSDIHTSKLLLMAACNAKNTQTARVAWARLSDTDRDRFGMICIRNGITRTELDGGPPPSCDHRGLASDGRDAEAAGDMKRAYELFTRADACNPHGYDQYLFSTACAVKDLAKAREVWSRMDVRLRPLNGQNCTELGGITPEQLDGTTPASALPPFEPPLTVPPTVLEGSRISGEKEILPDDATVKAIELAGQERLVGSVKLCLTAAGTIQSVAAIKSTGFVDYDRTIQNTIRSQWRYRPYEVDGKAVPVCTAVTFIYRR